MNDRHPLLKFMVFAAVCLGFAVWLVITIGNIKPFEDRTSYQAEFEDVLGLLPNDSVKVAGVAVGKVTSVSVDRGKALVTFTVRDDIELGADTQVAVRWRSVLGQRYLYVYPGPGMTVASGYRFPMDQTTNPADFGLLLERLTPVMRALEPDISNIFVRSLSEALVGREEDVQDLVADAASLASTLASRDDQIGRVLDSALVVVDAYADREQELGGLLDSFADVSSTLAARNDELLDAIVRITGAQAELRSLVERNDSELRGSLAALDQVAAVLSVAHDDLEDLVTSLGSGIVFYHRISRWGQWFNVRAVGGSNNGETFTSERGAEYPEGCCITGSARQNGMRGLFVPALDDLARIGAGQAR